MLQIELSSREDWTVKMVASNNQDVFPTAQGWVMSTLTFRGNCCNCFFIFISWVIKLKFGNILSAFGQLFSIFLLGEEWFGLGKEIFEFCLEGRGTDIFTLWIFFVLAGSWNFWFFPRGITLDDTLHNSKQIPLLWVMFNPIETNK